MKISRENVFSRRHWNERAVATDNPDIYADKLKTAPSCCSRSSNHGRESLNFEENVSRPACAIIYSIIKLSCVLEEFYCRKFINQQCVIKR
jgi:hypothetical protein